MLNMWVNSGELDYVAALGLVFHGNFDAFD